MNKMRAEAAKVKYYQSLFSDTAVTMPLIVSCKTWRIHLNSFNLLKLERKKKHKWVITTEWSLRPREISNGLYVPDKLQKQRANFSMLFEYGYLDGKLKVLSFNIQSINKYILRILQVVLLQVNVWRKKPLHCHKVLSRRKWNHHKRP